MKSYRQIIVKGEIFPCVAWRDKVEISLFGKCLNSTTLRSLPGGGVEAEADIDSLECAPYKEIIDGLIQQAKDADIFFGEDRPEPMPADDPTPQTERKTVGKKERIEWTKDNGKALHDWRKSTRTFATAIGKACGFTESYVFQLESGDVSTVSIRAFNALKALGVPVGAKPSEPAPESAPITPPAPEPEPAPGARVRTRQPEFGMALLLWRKSKGVSTAELARQLGCSATYLTTVEEGETLTIAADRYGRLRALGFKSPEQEAKEAFRKDTAEQLFIDGEPVQENIGAKDCIREAAKLADEHITRPWLDVTEAQGKFFYAAQGKAIKLGELTGRIQYHDDDGKSPSIRWIATKEGAE